VKERNRVGARKREGIEGIGVMHDVLEDLDHECDKTS